MANLYEGTPDARQSTSRDEPLSRFRPRYRALSEEEKMRHDQIKDAFSATEKLILELNPGRYRALALTSLEEACMWAVKELTT